MCNRVIAKVSSPRRKRRGYPPFGQAAEAADAPVMASIFSQLPVPAKPWIFHYRLIFQRWRPHRVHRGGAKDCPVWVIPER